MRDINYITKVKFLMNMFEGMVVINGSVQPNGVAQFKATINNMDANGQLDKGLSSLIKRIYGVENTDTFKISVQNEKVAQIKNVMNYVEQAATQSASDRAIIDNIGLLVNNKMVSKTVGDIVTDIYFEGTNLQKGRTEEFNKTQRDRSADLDMAKELERTRLIKGRVLTFSEISGLSLDEKKALIALYEKIISSHSNDKVCAVFKDIAYYETVNYQAMRDPCSGISQGRSRLSVNDYARPVDSIIVYKDEGDGCHGPSYYRLGPFVQRQLDEIKRYLLR